MAQRALPEGGGMAPDARQHPRTKDKQLPPHDLSQRVERRFIPYYFSFIIRGYLLTI